MPLPISKRSLYSWAFTKYLRLQALLLAIIVVMVATRVLPLEMQKRVINQAIGMRDMDALYLYSGMYLGFVVLSSTLKYVTNILQSYIGQKVLLEMRQGLFEHVLSLPLAFFRRTPPGTIINSLISEMVPVGEFVGVAFSMPVVNVLTFLVMAGYMFSLNATLAALSIAVYVADVAILPIVQRKFNQSNRKRVVATQELSSLVGESATGIQEVHANASYALEADKFRGRMARVYKTSLWMYIYKFGIKYVDNFFQSLGPFILFLVGGWLAIRGRFDLGAFVAFLSAYEKVYDPWRELMEFWQRYQDAKVRYKQIMTNFDDQSEQAAFAEGRDPYILRGEIRLRDVSYVVGGNIRLLDRINLDLREGEHLALVGFSGSGKSTLALVLAQLYRYTSGSVELGGMEVGELTKRDMVHNVGMVVQHPYIFSGSIRENLLYSCDALRFNEGDCHIPDEERLDRLIEAVQQVGLFLDVLRFALRSRLDPERHADLTDSIVRARMAFNELHRGEADEDIEFLDVDAFQQYGSIALNITFGAPRRPELAHDRLSENDFFLDFLAEHGLHGDLVRLGAEIARRTVEIVGAVGPSPDVFEQSPMAQLDHDTYAGIVDALHGRAPEELPRGDQRLLLKLALAFTPGMHKLVGLGPGLTERLLHARRAFMEHVLELDPGAFAFFDAKEHIDSQSIQDNILFGYIRQDNAGAENRVNQLIMQLLIVENVLERVLAIGLDFDVGSSGDRLSGGQRQKIALARAFLKSSPVIILDEATSALDNASQTRIQNLITRKWKGKSTVVSVIHRLDTLKNYDTVAVMKAGRIIEKGSYLELMEKKGALYELVTGNS